MRRETDSNVTTSQPISKRLRKTYNAPIPDDIIECGEEIEKQIQRSLEDIVETNDILKGIKLLSRQVRVSRRLSKKRRLKLAKLREVRRRCEELQQEYETKCREINSATVADPDELDSDTADHPDENSDTVNHPDENSNTVDSPDELDSDTTDSSDELDWETSDGSDYWDENTKEQENRLKEEYSDKICDSLKEQLNVTFNMRDEDVRDKELGDVIFYYVMRGEEPDEHVVKIINRLYEPLYNHTYSWRNYSWYESCCVMSHSEKTFSQFYTRLNNNKTALKCLLYRRPQLLLNTKSYWLTERMTEHLPYDNLHEIITNIKDENRQTCLFYVDLSSWYVQMYRNHINELYHLLSVQDKHGQTALHVNTMCIADLLSDLYTPKQRAAFIRLASITDNHNQTALQVCADTQVGNQFSSLLQRVENREYVTFSFMDTNILIIYNTHRRSGAEKEAQTIHDACRKTYRLCDYAIEKNKTEDQIINLIKCHARENDHRYAQSALIVILMSHGSVGTIDDCVGKPIKLSDIEKAMCSDILRGKPKMLITQCCQNRAEEIDEKLGKAYTPTHDDFCAVMSCVAGEKSTRGVLLGKLAEQIENCKSDTNIFKLVNNVSKEMEREGHKQTPIIMSTLKAEFCPHDDWTDSK